MKANFRSVAEQYASDELDYALEKYPAFNSPHEAYGVLAEEFKEVMDALHANDFVQLYKELGQVSAVAQKAMMMIDDKGLNNLPVTMYPKKDAMDMLGGMRYHMGKVCSDHRHYEDPAHHVCNDDNKPYRFSPCVDHAHTEDNTCQL